MCHFSLLVSFCFTFIKFVDWVWRRRHRHHFQILFLWARSLLEQCCDLYCSFVMMLWKDRVRWGKALYPFLLSFCGFREAVKEGRRILMFPLPSFILSFPITYVYQHFLAGRHCFGSWRYNGQQKQGWFLLSWSLWSGGEIDLFFFLIFKNYLFIWLCWVLVAAC